MTEVDGYVGHHVAKALGKILYSRPSPPLPPPPSPGPGGSEYEGSTRDESGGYDDEYEERYDVGSLPARLEIVGSVGSPESASFGLPTPAVLPGAEVAGAGVPECVSSVLPAGASREELYGRLVGCDVIVYDLVADVDEAKWVVESLAEEADSWARPKVFVGLSSVLTWGKTGRGDEGDGGEEMAFIEDDYKRRKPHPNHKDLVYVEKLLTKWSRKKENLHGFIINRGLLYGNGEGIFHFLFKMAWHGTPRQLPVIGRGRNVLPTIHVEDFASIVAQVLATRPDDIKYILAVDDGRMTAMDMVTTISETLGTGAIKRVKRDDPTLVRELTPLQFDMLHLDVMLEPAFVRELEDMVWVSETGMLDAIFDVIAEYKAARQLTPLMFYVNGPPGSGKSFYASRIAREYKVHHIQIGDVIAEYIARLTTSKDPNDQDALEELKEVRAEDPNGYIPDDYLIPIVREKLLSMPCQNQGFVLDGFPKTLAQAEDLFAGVNSADESLSVLDENLEGVDTSILPTNIIVLEANDEFIRERMRSLPESQVAGTHWDEAGVTRRLAWFREHNTLESSVWDYFDTREILPLYIDVTRETDVKANMTAIRKLAGKPHNYGPTKKELAARAAAAAEAEAKAAAKAAAAAQAEAEATAEAEAKRDAEWASRMKVIQQDEHNVLQVQSEPLREFLMEHVMPTLTEGLIEVCKVRPDDPVDYLAEYLFNQDGRDLVYENPHHH